MGVKVGVSVGLVGKGVFVTGGAVGGIGAGVRNGMTMGDVAVGGTTTTNRGVGVSDVGVGVILLALSSKRTRELTATHNKNRTIPMLM